MDAACGGYFFNLSHTFFHCKCMRIDEINRLFIFHTYTNTTDMFFVYVCQMNMYAEAEIHRAR